MPKKIKAIVKKQPCGLSRVNKKPLTEWQCFVRDSKGTSNAGNMTKLAELYQKEKEDSIMQTIKKAPSLDFKPDAKKVEALQKSREARKTVSEALAEAMQITDPLMRFELMQSVLKMQKDIMG